MYIDNYISELIHGGVKILRPDSVVIERTVNIEPDVVIYPNVVLLGHANIGKRSVIYQGVEISDSVIGENSVVRMCCEIRDSDLGCESKVGPFTRVSSSAFSGFSVVDSYTMVKNSEIGNAVKIGPNAYISDCRIHSGVTISAGVITANYDGLMKHRTIIEDDVFVGTDVQLIAPVTIHKGATLAAGSIITKDAPSDTLTISRTKQVSISGWSRPHKMQDLKEEKMNAPASVEQIERPYGDVIKEFCELVERNETEEEYHNFIKENYWLIGSGYEACLTKIRAGSKHIPDLVLERDDGTYELVELKRPGAKIFVKNNRHIVESSDVKLAIGQLDEYLHHYRVHYLSESHINRKDFYVSKGVVVIGRTKTDEERKSLRRISERYRDIDIMSYDDLISVGRRVVRLFEKSNE